MYLLGSAPTYLARRRPNLFSDLQLRRPPLPPLSPRLLWLVVLMASPKGSISMAGKGKEMNGEGEKVAREGEKER